MMSLQTSTHSSQMKTVGPAMSFRTSFWSLLQKEHRRTSVSPAFFTICVSCSADRTRRAGLETCTTCGYLRPFADDIVNNTVFLALFGRHDVVALGVVLDALDRLPRVVHQDLVEALPHTEDLAGCNI